MTLKTFKNQPMPRFDPSTGANPFLWIVTMAPRVRAERALADLVRRAGRRKEFRPLSQSADTD